MNFPAQNIRQCNGCTACCDGWLSGTVYGHSFWPGRPCHFRGNGCCTIYQSRPKDPCQDFVCSWLRDLNIPAWMKPNECKVLIVDKVIDNQPYVELMELGERLNVLVLSWFFIAYAQGKLKNLHWQIDGGWNYCGTQEFVDAMNKKNLFNK